MQRRLHRSRWIRLLPLGDFLVETRQHLLGRELSEDSHLFRERIPVESDDPTGRKNGPRKWWRSFYRPAPVLESRGDGFYEGETVLLGTAFYRGYSDRRILGSRIFAGTRCRARSSLWS